MSSINLRQQLPIQNIERIMFCQSIKEIGVEKIESLNRKHEPFLLHMVSEEGVEYNEIDWEFILFEATSYQMGELLDNFIAKPKKPAKHR